MRYVLINEDCSRVYSDGEMLPNGVYTLHLSAEYGADGGLVDWSAPNDGAVRGTMKYLGRVEIGGRK